VRPIPQSAAAMLCYAVAPQLGLGASLRFHTAICLDTTMCSIPHAWEEPLTSVDETLTRLLPVGGERTWEGAHWFESRCRGCPPVVVRSIVPPSPTAVQVFASVHETALSQLEVMPPGARLDWSAQVAPPSVVRRMVPRSPTTVPFLRSVNNMPLEPDIDVSGLGPSGPSISSSQDGEGSNRDTGVGAGAGYGIKAQPGATSLGGPSGTAVGSAHDGAICSHRRAGIGVTARDIEETRDIGAGQTTRRTAELLLPGDPSISGS